MGTFWQKVGYNRWVQIAFRGFIMRRSLHYRKTYVTPHEGGFRYKRRVPLDLHPVIGKTFWLSWLGTDREDATLKGTALALDHQKLIVGLHRLRKRDPSGFADIVKAGGFENWQQRTEGTEFGIPFVEAAASKGVGYDPAAPREIQAEQVMETMQRQELLAEMRAEIVRARGVKRRLEGKEPQEAALFELCDLWERVRNPRSAKAREKTRLFVRRFVNFAGDLKPREVTRDHAAGFRDKLEKNGETSTNIQQHLEKLLTLFNVGLSEGVVTANPFHKIKARPDQKKFTSGKQPFSPEQARSIFQALRGEPSDFAWAMKLLAYHGARGGEICQLRVDDVTTLNGVPVLRIHDQNGSLKNAASVRDVPIHPRCNGIIAYAKRVAAKHGADAWLFQSFKDHKQGRAHRFQDKGSRFLRTKIGITDVRLTIHSWRHTFRTSARNVEMPLSVSHALMGHAEGGEHGKYGDRPSLKLCAKWIAKVDPLRG